MYFCLHEIIINNVYFFCLKNVFLYFFSFFQVDLFFVLPTQTFGSFFKLFLIKSNYNDWIPERESSCKARR